MRGYVIEGVIGAGKSTLLRAMEEQISSRFPGTSRMVLTEHYTDRLFEDDRRDGSASFAEALDHCEEIARRVVWLADVKYASKFGGLQGPAAVHVIIERFIGTHVAHHTADRALTDDESMRAESLLRSMAEVDIASVVLEVEPSVMAASIAETRKIRSESWTNYLNSIGDDDQIVEFFEAWQSRLLAFYDEHDPDHVRIVIDDLDAARDMSERAADLLTDW